MIDPLAPVQLSGPEFDLSKNFEFIDGFIYGQIGPGVAEEFHDFLFADILHLD